MLNLSQDHKIYDCSHPIDSDLLTFPRPWHRSVVIETLGKYDEVGRRSSHVSIGTHSGTHIDAPSHFIDKGISIDEVPLKFLVGSGVVINVDFSAPFAALDYKLLTAKVQNCVRNTAIFLNFNWSHMFNQGIAYYETQPWIDLRTAEFIADLSPTIVGYDLAMLDNPRDGFGCEIDSPIHKLFLGRGIPLLENAVFPPGFHGPVSYAALPLRLRGLDGSPVRFIVWR